MSHAHGRRLRRLFASLAVRNYRWFFAGRLISASGTAIAGVTEMWWLAGGPDSGLWIGLYVTAFALPSLLGGAWAGLLADRLSKRRLLVVAELGLMVNETAVWWFAAGDALRPWIVVLTACTWSAINTVASPARDTFTGELVGTDRLPNAVALNSLSVYAAGIVGYVSAGLIIVHWRLTVGWAVSALSSGALLLAVAYIRGDELHRVPAVPRAPRQVRGALRVVRDDPALWIPICGVAVIAVLSLNLGTVTPLLANETYGNAGMYAALSTGTMIGSAVGALIAAAMPKLAPVVFFALVGALGVCQALAAAGTCPPGTWSRSRWRASPRRSCSVLSTPISSSRRRGDARTDRGALPPGMSGSSVIGGPLTGWLADLWSARVVLLAGGLSSVLAALVFGMLAARLTRD